MKKESKYLCACAAISLGLASCQSSTNATLPDSAPPVSSGNPGPGENLDPTHSGAPTIADFTSAPGTAGATLLSWAVRGAESVSLLPNPNSGATLGPAGSLSVSPTTTTTYALIASNSAGMSSSVLTVAVGSTASTTSAPSITKAESGESLNYFQVTASAQFTGTGLSMTGDNTVLSTCPGLLKVSDAPVPGSTTAVAISVTVTIPRRDTQCYFLITRPDGMAGLPVAVDPGWAVSDLKVTLDTINYPEAWFDGHVVIQGAPANTPVQLLIDGGPLVSPDATTDSSGDYTGNLDSTGQFTDVCYVAIAVGNHFDAIWFC